MKKRIIIPFDSEIVGDEEPLLRVMIYAVAMEYHDMVYDFIDQEAAASFVDQNDIDVELRRLMDIADRVMPMLVPLIMPLVTDGVIDDDTVINEVYKFGHNDTMLYIDEGEQWR